MHAHLTTLRLKKLMVRGFKSIAACDLELAQRTILIGANGSGKSNLLGIFRFMEQVVAGQLGKYVNVSGKANAILHCGRAITKELMISLEFTEHVSYQAVWKPTDDNRLYFDNEDVSWLKGSTNKDGMPARSYHWSAGKDESILSMPKMGTEIDNAPDIDCWRIYHVHDTGTNSPLKIPQNSKDDAYLRSDGENLMPFLRRLRDQFPKYYEQIRFAVSLAMPTFGDFIFKDDNGTLSLCWRERQNDYPYAAHQVSDGTLRFMCLATLLLQPVELQPSLIIIDEPELGLHPSAIHLLGEMIKAASVHRQVLVATQSPALLDAFTPEDIVLVERGDEGTTIRRQDATDLKSWLEDYTLGQVWNMNLLGGRP